MSLSHSLSSNYVLFPRHGLRAEEDYCGHRCHRESRRFCCAKIPPGPRLARASHHTERLVARCSILEIQWSRGHCSRPGQHRQSEGSPLRRKPYLQRHKLLGSLSTDLTAARKPRQPASHVADTHMTSSTSRARTSQTRQQRQWKVWDRTASLPLP